MELRSHLAKLASAHIHHRHGGRECGAPQGQRPRDLARAPLGKDDIDDGRATPLRCATLGRADGHANL